MTRSAFSRRALAFYFFFTIVFTVAAKSTLMDGTAIRLSNGDVEEKLQVRAHIAHCLCRTPLVRKLLIELKECSIVQSLNADKLRNAPETASYAAKLFALLFPSSSPAINALLATAYISGPPNFLLALCPPNIDPASLTIMVAFAVGGLLGDTLFHLLPEIFLGEDEPNKVRFVMLEPNRNLLLGVAIIVGLVTFVAMDKS